MSGPHDPDPRTPDEILDALDPEQRDVASTLTGPLCVLAGAGTGKTRAITHRIAYGVLSGVFTPQRVLAVTFTARAAGEMRSRLRDLGVAGVQARTFHAAALRQLHYFWPQAIGGAAPEVLPQKAGLVAEAASRLRLPTDRAAVRDLAAEVEWAKVSLLTPETYAAAARRAGRDPAGQDPTAVARLLEGYEQAKQERGVIDFEDVLLVTAGVLQENRAIAEPCASSTATSSSTSTRTSTRSSSACSTSGSAAATSCAWSATRPRPSTRSPAPAPSICSASRSATRRPG